MAETRENITRRRQSKNLGISKSNPLEEHAATARLFEIMHSRPYLTSGHTGLHSAHCTVTICKSDIFRSYFDQSFCIMLCIPYTQVLYEYGRYNHKTSGFETSGFKTSGFKTSGFKTSGLQNVKFTKRQVSKRLVAKRPVFKFDILLKQKV